MMSECSLRINIRKYKEIKTSEKMCDQYAQVQKITNWLAKCREYTRFMDLIRCTRLDERFIYKVGYDSFVYCPIRFIAEYFRLAMLNKQDIFMDCFADPISKNKKNDLKLLTSNKTKYILNYNIYN